MNQYINKLLPNRVQRYLRNFIAKQIHVSDFDAKYEKVTEIFSDWMPDDFDFTKATILDFGCDYGIITLAIALKLKPKKVIGVDINSHHRYLLGIVQDRIHIDAIPDNLEFYKIDPSERLSQRFHLDCIFTWSTLEHVSQPYLQDVVSEMYKALNPDGMVFLQIAPLYYSAFGSHLDSLIATPWAHLRMQNDLLQAAVMSAPKNALYVNEKDRHFKAIKKGIWDCYISLNKITADDIIELFENNGFTALRQYRTSCQTKPPEQLTRIYAKEILETEQIVVLFRKNV